MYRVRSTGEVLSQGQVRSLYPNTSFPSQWTPALVEELGLDPVFETPAPTTTIYQTAYKDGVEQVDGKWVWKWSVSEMDDEAKAAKDAEAAKGVRSTRDAKLAECDWLVIKSVETGIALAADWATYRQALRDVPAQAGFPHDITWPEKP
jgi:hypothetical protein